MYSIPESVNIDANIFQVLDHIWRRRGPETQRKKIWQPGSVFRFGSSLK